MPRKQQPPRRLTEANAFPAWALRGKIEAIVKAWLKITARRLPDAVLQRLILELVHAVGTATAGVPEWPGGSRAKQAAWTLDVYMFDLCDALRAAGVPVVARRNPAGSHAQTLGRMIAKVAGLRGHGGRGVGSLFEQMRRARAIHKKCLPTVTIAVTIPDPAE